MNNTKLVHNKLAELKLRETCYCDSRLESDFHTCNEPIRRFLAHITDITGEKPTNVVRWSLASLNCVVYTFGMWEGEKAIVFHSFAQPEFLHLNITASLFVHLFKNI